MLLFLYGPDTFRSRQQLKKIIAKFKHDRDPQGLNVVRIDVEKEAHSGKILEQILTIPFLAERRMVVLENLLVSKHKELQSELFCRIEEERLPASTVLVFWEGVEKVKGKDATDFFERLTREKFAQRFDLLKGIKLGGWIAAEVTERGGKMTAPATQYLATNLANDMWRLSSLIDQLVSYRPGIEIDLADIQLFFDEKINDNIFALVDAIVARQTKSVYQMIQEQYRQGEDVQYMLAMIIRQFRILLQMRDVFEREETLPSELMAKKLNLHPFVVKKSLVSMKRYTLAQLKDVYDALLTLDVHIKTGYAAPETLLDVFVARVGSG